MKRWSGQIHLLPKAVSNYQRDFMLWEENRRQEKKFAHLAVINLHWQCECRLTHNVLWGHPVSATKSVHLCCIGTLCEHFSMHKCAFVCGYSLEIHFEGAAFLICLCLSGHSNVVCFTEHCKAYTGLLNYGTLPKTTRHSVSGNLTGRHVCLIL